MKKLIVVLLLSFFSISQAKDPIEIISSAPAGGGTGIHAQLVADMFTEYGWPTVVTYRTGGEGLIGANTAATSKPDGKTLIMGTMSIMSLHIAQPLEGMKYNENTFMPISLINQFGIVLAVPADSEIKNYEDFKFFVKNNPSKFNIGLGNTATNFFVKEWANREGLPMPNIILYRGSTPLLTDLIGKHVPFIWDNYTVPLEPLIKSGQIRILAAADSTSTNRIEKQMPKSKVVDISAIHKDLEIGNWYGLFAPAGTDPHLILEMNSIINKSSQLPKFKQVIDNLNIHNIGGTPEMLSALQKRDISTFKKWK